MNKKARIEGLLQEVKQYYKTSARGHLPWRRTRDPYRILVSELMLQQTQVERVVPYYKKFIKQFPNWHFLARAKLAEVLQTWQGLGYNRRAKYLHETAKILSRAEVSHGEVGLPQAIFLVSPERRTSAKQLSTEFWERLPGVGHYTARAIAAFAYNRPEIFIETNIRTVFFHSGILKNTRIDSKIADAEILPLIEQALKKSKMQPRDFYAALMDYGAYLKKSGVRLNARSKHYTKQSKFEGSARQLRGALLRELLKNPATLAQLTKNLAWSRGEVERELKRLERDGIVKRLRRVFAIAV